MPRGSISTVTLPTARAEQLREVAKARGVSLTELIGLFVGAEIRKGTIADAIPGYRVEVVRRHVEFEFAGRMLRLGREDAIEVADHILEVVETGGGWLRHGGAWLSIDNGFQAVRAGKGIAFTTSGQKRPHALSIDIARDLARMLYKAAKSRRVAPSPPNADREESRRERRLRRKRAGR